MPKINMTIDLDIEEGLYIKIDAAGRVSIKAEEKQTLIAMPPAAMQALRELDVPKQAASGSWASAKDEILAKRKRSTIDELKRQREAILHLMQPFTHDTLRELGVTLPKHMTTRLLREGSIRIAAPRRGRPGQHGGRTPTIFEVVHNA